MTFLIVLNAGHMVPLDQPRSALDMLKRFLRAEPFSDSAQTALGIGSCSGKDALDCTEPPACADPSPGAAALPPTPPPPPSPRIVGTPLVGQNSATVEFTPGGEGGAGGGGGEIAASFFEARSSPDGVVGVGSESPLVVDGLTPGRAYTFSVTAVYSAGSGGGGGAGGGGEGAELLRSSPSVGSPAVTPGCDQGGGGGAACGGRGVCREGGQVGVCVCENGYAGEACGVLLVGGVRGGGGGVMIGPGTGVGAAAGAGDDTGDIMMLREEDLPALPKSAKVCFLGEAFFFPVGVAPATAVWWRLVLAGPRAVCFRCERGLLHAQV